MKTLIEQMSEIQWQITMTMVKLQQQLDKDKPLKNNDLRKNISKSGK